MLAILSAEVLSGRIDLPLAVCMPQIVSPMTMAAGKPYLAAGCVCHACIEWLDVTPFPCHDEDFQALKRDMISGRRLSNMSWSINIIRPN